MVSRTETKVEIRAYKCFVPESVTYVLGLFCYLCARFVLREATGTGAGL